jgi:hypothetical protein
MPDHDIQDILSTAPLGRFALGQFLPPIVAEQINEIAPGSATGWWRCDIENGNQLTWSDEVYDLFGIPHATSVRRDKIVARYLEHSRLELERVRSSAITEGKAFVLDAEIRAPNDKSSWIRIVAVPLLEKGRVTALRGLKWALESRAQPVRDTPSEVGTSRLSFAIDRRLATDQSPIAKPLRELAAQCRKVAAMGGISAAAARDLLAMAEEYDALAEIERQGGCRGGPSVEIT